MPAGFDTITYRDVWDRAGAVAAALADDPIRPGDRVGVLGFTGADLTVFDIALIRMAAVAVPIQASAAISGLLPIVAETEPRVIATRTGTSSPATRTFAQVSTGAGGPNSMVAG